MKKRFDKKFFRRVSIALATAVVLLLGQVAYQGAVISRQRRTVRECFVALIDCACAPPADSSSQKIQKLAAEKRQTGRRTESGVAPQTN